MKKQPSYSMQLSQNFNINEFINDTDAVTLNTITNLTELATQLQKLRNAIGQPIRITSGYRTIKHNKIVGGVPNSKHLTGKAADIQVKNTTPDQVYNNVQFLTKHSHLKLKAIVYANHVHVHLQP